jgi:hypothetical protein
LADRLSVFGTESFPGRPAPLSVRVRLLLPKASLLEIVAVAVLVGRVGAKVTDSFCDFPGARLNVPGEILKTEVSLSVTVPVRFPAPFLAAFLMVNDGLVDAGLVVVTPTPADLTVIAVGTLIFAPFGVGVAVGVVGVPPVAVGVGVGVGIFDVEVAVGVAFKVEVAVTVAFDVDVGVGIGVAVRVGVGVTEATPSLNAPRPWVPIKITPEEFCSMS